MQHGTSSTCIDILLYILYRINLICFVMRSKWGVTSELILSSGNSYTDQNALLLELSKLDKIFLNQCHWICKILPRNWTKQTWTSIMIMPAPIIKKSFQVSFFKVKLFFKYYIKWLIPRPVILEKVNSMAQYSFTFLSLWLHASYALIWCLGLDHVIWFGLVWIKGFFFMILT